MAVTTMIGARVQRREDPKLITGHGHYVDDISLVNMAHMSVVRSPHAHARITSIDTSHALASKGVVAVLTSAEIKPHILGPIPVTASFVPDKKQVPEQYPIASDEVLYAGEPVAIVIAEDRYLADDAAQLVVVDYEPLPAVMDLEKAMAPGSPLVKSDRPDNIGWEAVFPSGDIDAAFAEADVVVKERIGQQRLFPTAMETRGCVADWTPYDNRVTLWTSTQVPHFIRLFVGGALGVPESQFRVISHDVGGGFGAKLRPYPEEYLATAASKICGRPVKWIEDRTESLQATTQGRGQLFDMEVAAKRDGTLLGLKFTQLLDIGAYHGVFGAFQVVACLLGGGCYDWKAISAKSIGIFTNRMSTDPYRGAGRPEATHLVERAVDLVALEIGMDPAEVRRKNFVKTFPHTNNFGLVYDSGDYEKSLDLAMANIGYPALRKRQEELRAQGRYMGIGFSTWVEICGLGPSSATAPAAGIALVESSMVRVHPTGSVTVSVGTHAHGQSHETTFAQIVADQLGIPMESVEIRHGDTGDTPFGYGTYGSRSLAVGGMAIVASCHKVVEKARKLAAHAFEASEDDIVVDQGRYFVRGNPAEAKVLAELAFASYGAGLPEGMEQGLEAVSYFDPPNFVWPFGCHICAVEVDPETGAVTIDRYVAVDDCGNVINPMVVDGQLHGGIAQGISQALFEEVQYDDATGQMLTGTLLDYLVPTMAEMPLFELDRTVTPSPTNELGVKGIGEAGTIASSAAVINAITDALIPFGIKHVEMPARPDRIWSMIKEARA
ncbi:MAG TPA: molybdopterin cofactor-binding domain-containing protein [Candidatus Acidoferrales bacterium]|nr:molybdopterin cofactor-binding domain-containing protein [Candidatus Acidoferrales bacterium]